MDWQSIQPIFLWLGEHPVWSGVFVFLIALSESLLVVGLIVPGTVLMFGVGTLVGAGVLDVKLTFFLAFLGAVLGDGISFWIGRHYREQLVTFWPFNKHPHYFDKGKRFFKRHGSKSILFGRFIGPIRPIVPAVAGMMGMPKRQFFIVNVVSAMGWAPVYLIPGIVFGTSIGLASAIGTRLLVLIISVVVFVLLFAYIIRKSMMCLRPLIQQWIMHLHSWAKQHPVASKVLSRLMEPASNSYFELLMLCFFFFLILSFIALFFIFVLAVLFNSIDVFATNFWSLIDSEFLTAFFSLIQSYFSWLVLMLLAVNVCLLVFAEKIKQALMYLIFVIVFAMLSVFMLTIAFKLFTVDLNILYFSAIKVNLFFVVLIVAAVIFMQNLRQYFHWLVYAGLLLFLSFGIFSELYFYQLSVSFISISLMFTSIWLLVGALLFVRRQELSIPKIKHLAGTLLLIIIAGSLIVSSGINDYKSRLNMNDIITNLDVDNWLVKDWQKLPQEKDNFFESQNQRLNIQWGGALQDIRHSLTDAGWVEPQPPSLKSVLLWIAPEPQINELARFPQTIEGQAEKLVMVKYDKKNNTQLVLQFWQNRTEMLSDQPLWVGSISLQGVGQSRGWLLSFKFLESQAKTLGWFERSIKSWQHNYGNKTAKLENRVLLIYDFQSM